MEKIEQLKEETKKLEKQYEESGESKSRINMEVIAIRLNVAKAKLQILKDVVKLIEEDIKLQKEKLKDEKKYFEDNKIYMWRIHGLQSLLSKITGEEVKLLGVSNR